MSNFKFENGQKAKDKITGFEGTITGRADYITGCNQYLIAPPVDKEKKHVDGVWYDESRLEIWVELDVEDTPPGAGKPAPIK